MYGIQIDVPDVNHGRNVCPGGEGGGYSKKFYTGRFRSEVQSLPLLYTIFFRIGTPNPISYSWLASDVIIFLNPK